VVHCDRALFILISRYLKLKLPLLNIYWLSGQSGLSVLSVLIWDWNLIRIWSFEIAICCSDLGFKFWSWDLGFESKDLIF